MFASSLLLALALAADAPPTSPGADPVAQLCTIGSIDDQCVPGTDPGVLLELKVREGMRVTKGMEIGRIDDNEAKALFEVKRLEAEAADQTAKSDIDIRHAEAAAKVAEAAYKKQVEANKQFKSTVTEIELLRSQLDWKKMLLAKEQADEKQIEAKLTAKAKRAEVGAADVALKRRVLRAPFDGVVVLCYKHPGEWVAAGEPIVQVVGIHRLRVSGTLEANEWAPADIENRKVTVLVQLPRGQTKNVPGVVTFVSPVVDSSKMHVWAEIEAPMEGGPPVVRAGQEATMTIHVSQPLAKQSEPAIRKTSASVPAKKK